MTVLIECLEFYLMTLQVVVEWMMSVLAVLMSLMALSPPLVVNYYKW